MKPLVSVAVFGLVPIPPADIPISSGHDLRAMRENCDFSRLVFLCRPIVKRMATKEELGHIRAELKEIGQRAKFTRSRLIRIGAFTPLSATAKSRHS